MAQANQKAVTPALRIAQPHELLIDNGGDILKPLRLLRAKYAQKADDCDVTLWHLNAQPATDENKRRAARVLAGRAYYAAAAEGVVNIMPPQIVLGSGELSINGVPVGEVSEVTLTLASEAQ